SDGHDATPDATGAGKVNGSSAQFTWKDSQGNTGTGTISLSGDDIIVSMTPVHVADSRCLVFYRQKMKLKRVRKGTYGFALRDERTLCPLLHRYQRSKTPVSAPTTSLCSEGNRYTIGRNRPTISCKRSVIWPSEQTSTASSNAGKQFSPRST